MKFKVILAFDFLINEKMINFIYLPIIGNNGVLLYNYLYNQSLFNTKIGNNISFDLNELYHSLNINEVQFQEIKAKLEALNLITTYIDNYKKDCLFIKLNNCINWNEFKNNSNYIKLLKQSTTEVEYEKIRYCFDSDQSLIGLTNVSQTFENQFNIENVKKFNFINLYDDLLKYTNQLIEIDEQLKLKINDLYIKNELSYSEILSIIYQSFYKVENKIKIDEKIFNLKCKSILDSRNVGNFNLNIKNNRDLNIFLKKFNNQELNKILENYKALNSEQYLSCIQSAPINKIDINLIELLRKNYKLPDFIINILIDFSIFVNNGKIEPLYIQSIAVTLNRLNYDNIGNVLTHLQKTAKYKMNVN